MCSSPTAHFLLDWLCLRRPAVYVSQSFRLRECAFFLTLMQEREAIDPMPRPRTYFRVWRGGSCMGWVMRKTTILAAALLAASADAHEYQLQYTPNYGARGVTVAGYAFNGNSVVGNCSYYTVTSGSGRGGGYRSTTTYYNHTCTWDLYGNLLSMAQGSPAAPTPLSTGGGLTIYAQDTAGDTTGVDTANGNIGFVNSISAQYSWITPSGGTVLLSSQKPVLITVKLHSDGDVPLQISKVEPAARLAKISVRTTNCERAPVSPGSNCAIVMFYDPRGLPPGDDPYTAYDALTVGIVSNSGQAPDFSESIEVPVAPGR
jgi:hypothetical protein